MRCCGDGSSGCPCHRLLNQPEASDAHVQSDVQFFALKSGPLPISDRLAGYTLGFGDLQPSLHRNHLWIYPVLLPFLALWNDVRFHILLLRRDTCIIESLPVSFGFPEGTLCSYQLGPMRPNTAGQHMRAILGVGTGFRGFVGRVRDRSVALGCPPTSPRESTRLYMAFHEPSFFGSLSCWGSSDGVCLVGRVRGRSVALGCPPTSKPCTLLAFRALAMLPTCEVPAWLHLCIVQLEAFFIALQALFALALWRLLVRALPGRSTPLAKLMLLPCAAGTDGLVLPLGGYRGAQGIVDPNGVRTSRQRRLGRPLPSLSRCSVWWLRLLTAFGLFSMPVQVWAAPKGLREALSHADLIVAAREASPADDNPEHLSHLAEGQANPWRQMVAQVQAESLCEAYGPEVFGDFPGLVAHLQPSENAVSATQGGSVTSARDVTPAQSSVPPPQNLSSEAGLDASEVETSGLGVALDVPAFVAAAGYRIASCSVGVAFPSSVESIESQVRTHVADLLEESGDQLAPVYPQVVPGVAAFVSYPPWFSEAGLVTAFLDARAIRGHAFAIVLSFPTSAEEIRRAAGFSSVMAHNIFVSGHPSPLRPGAPVELQAGALIRLLPAGSKPLWAAPLAFALWHPHYWPSGVLVPRTREAACALVLHRSGKYLYDRFCSDDWVNQNGIATLVGVPLADVRMQAADPQEMLPYVYRGSPVRGVLAVVERGHGRDAQDRALPYLFLDSRPLGFDLNFVVCDSTTLTIEWLLQYLQQPPPAGWKLVVKGGQRHGRMIDFLPGEVLILAFHRCDYEGEEQHESEQGVSPDPEQDDDQSPDEGHGSDSSTRSRSRGHESAPRSQSADHSYQGLQTPPEGGVANSCIHRKGEVQGHDKVATRGHSRAPDINVHVEALSCILGSLAQLGAPICTLRVPDFAGICLRMCGGANETGQGQPFPPDPRDPGDRSPRRPHPPNFRAAPPELAPAAVQATVRARFVLLIEGYRPEAVPLTLPVPCDIACAIQELQTYRMPDVRRLFPRLLPVPHQPATGFAVFLATPRWPKSEVEVVLDCRTFSGLLHMACLPPVANLALLRARAGIAWWRNAEVWIEPYTRPVPENEVFRLFPGSVVVFLTANAPAPRMTDLTTMLRSADCWDHLEPLPFLYDPALWVVTDEGAFRFAVEGNRPRRFVLAHALEYDPSRLVVIGPEPSIRNFCDQGASTDAVIVVSQNVPINRASDTGLCVVVIDQRPILLGVTWKVVTNGLFSMGRYAAELPRRCPAGYQLAFSGAFPLFGTDLLRVADATCLTVEFVAVRPFPHDGADDNSDSGPTVHTLHSNDEGSSSYDSDSDSSGSGPPAGPPPPRPLTSPGPPHWCAQMIALLGTCAVPAAAESPLTAQPASSADPSWLFAIIHFWMLGFVCRIVSSFLGRYLEAISCKSADDPSFGHSPHWALESLSVATRLLQIPPCALPRDLARLLGSGELVEGLVGFEPIDVAVTFVILKPAYSPEFVTLVLQLPCTRGEVEAPLLDARVTAMCVRFPFVWPVAYQHIPGFAVLLAAPRWDPHAVVVCLNSAAFDGRVYAAYAPSYIDHDGLCWLASMPSGIDFDVFVDGDDQPLARGPDVHLAQGMQIVYVEAGQVPTAGHALHQLLLTPAFWEGDASFPAPDLPDSYCIATASRHILCACDFGRPWRLKRHIAAVIGLTRHDFHILPSAPPVRDIDVDGVKCRTLLAACSCGRQEANCQAFFLDMRPVREGLRLRFCHGFTLDLDGLPRTDGGLRLLTHLWRMVAGSFWNQGQS